MASENDCFDKDEVRDLLRLFMEKNPHDWIRKLYLAFGVAVPTMKRWKRGTHCPPPAMIPPLKKYLKNETKAGS